MEEGQVVRIAMPQADGEHKPRPAILLKRFPPDDDWLMVGITGSLGRAVPDLDVLIDFEHPSFALTRLAYPGLVRMAHAHVLPVEQIEGIIGRIDPATLALIKKRFTEHILHT